MEGVLAGLSATDSKQKIIAVTGLILFRASTEWEVEDTIALHPDLIDEIYMLYLEEDKRSVEAFEALDSTPSQEEPGK